MAQETKTNTFPFPLPSADVWAHVAKLSIQDDRPIMMDYYADSFEKKALIGIREKIPENFDTKSELKLGIKYANRWIFYWAANKESSYKIKKAPDAYGINYTNMGITKSDNKGKIIFKLECPQPYSVNGKTYYPHIHFMVSNSKNQHWELKVRTINIVCNFTRQKVKSAIKNGSYLIINALRTDR